MIFWWVNTFQSTMHLHGLILRCLHQGWSGKLPVLYSYDCHVMSSYTHWKLDSQVRDCNLSGIPSSLCSARSAQMRMWYVWHFWKPGRLLFSHQNSIGPNAKPANWVWLMDSVPKSYPEICTKTKTVYLWPQLSSLDIIGGPFWLPSVLTWPENAPWTFQCQVRFDITDTKHQKGHRFSLRTETEVATNNAGTWGTHTMSASWKRIAK